MSDLPSLKKTRGHHRARVTNKCRLARSNVSTLSASEKLQYVSILKDLKSKLDSFNDNIREKLWQEHINEKDLDDEFETCDSYDDEIFAVISLLETSGSYVVQHDDRSRSHIKYPTLPLPFYSHKEGESLEKFFMDFEKAMNTMNVDSYVKFIYLQKQLSGQPLALVKSLASTEQTYEEAKNLLNKAFGSDILRKFETLHSLSDLKLTYQTDPYEFVGKMKTIKNCVTALKISTDEVLQYFFWNAMNDNFKSHLTAINNKNRPSLKEIEDNLFEATERYVAVQNKYSEQRKGSKYKAKESTNLAVNIDQDKSSSPKGCNLCSADGSDTNHPIFKCPVYKSPEAKVQKLDELGACITCANSHNTKKCTFRFQRRCTKCGNWHFSFLCAGSQSKSSPVISKDKLTLKDVSSDSKKGTVKSKDKPKSETNTEVACTSFESLYMEDICVASILPTFSAVLTNGVLFRALKDSGSQLSFVDLEFAKQNGLEVIKSNFPFTLNGINSSKKLVTDVVKVEIYSGEEKHCLEAVCLPQIKTRLIIPGLQKVVTEFKSKGYNLADQFLADGKDEITGIKFILGVNSTHFLPDTTVLFGDPIPSAYLNTSLGTMLSGKITRLISNLRFLPDLNYTTQLAGSGAIDEVPNAHSGSLFDTNINYSVVDDQGKLIQSKLQKATEEILHEQCFQVLDYEPSQLNETSVEAVDKLVKYVLDSASRTEDGRLVLPLLWNPKVSHLLGKNQTLSRQILKSNFKRYHKDGSSLAMIDNVFKAQENMGIIERVDDVPKFLEEHPNYSFLPHMPVIRKERESTKYRVVFLSNLSEPEPTKPMTVSHNQAMLPGPCLNKKLSTTLLQLKFDKHVLVFDIKKAFLQIQLPDSDQVKLLFYWYRNVAKNDFNLVVFKHLRLPFGLRPSPTLLLLGLYKMLILDTAGDSQDLVNLKRLIYDLLYMDNCALSFQDKNKLKWAYGKLESIFAPYKFDL